MRMRRRRSGGCSGTEAIPGDARGHGRGCSRDLAIALFFVTPLVLTSLAFSVDQNPVLFNALAGGIRLVLFLVYLLLIAQMKDVKRLFAYHGAEHKTVFAYERGRRSDGRSGRLPEPVPSRDAVRASSSW